jgi:hypothetical protein
MRILRRPEAHPYTILKEHSGTAMSMVPWARERKEESLEFKMVT